jgi:hypothetical protein
LLRWVVDQGIATALIDPGKPWQNGVTESFNGKFRDECLSLEWFRSRAEAKVLIETWRRHFNTVRPHSSLGYLTPAAFSAKFEKQGATNARATGHIGEFTACGQYLVFALLWVIPGCGLGGGGGRGGGGGGGAGGFGLFAAWLRSSHIFWYSTYGPGTCSMRAL